jgi:Integrase zinc binding domain/Integrase core domain
MHLQEVALFYDSVFLPEDTEWAKQQREDPEWYPLIRWIEKGELPAEDEMALSILKNAHKYALEGKHNILVKVSKVDEEDDVETIRQIVPTQLRKLVVSQYHDSIYQGAHVGRDKCLSNLQRKYYFLNMKKYVENYVQTCSVCQRVKDPQQASFSPHGVIEAKHPWDLVSIDLWSPGVRSRSGNIYVLTVIDGFTKWAQTVSIPNKEARTVALALQSIFTTWGPPKRLHSDLGSEFVNETLREL